MQQLNISRIILPLNVSSAEVEKLWSKIRKLHLKYDTKKCCLIINFNNIKIKNSVHQKILQRE